MHRQEKCFGNVDSYKRKRKKKKIVRGYAIAAIFVRSLQSNPKSAQTIINMNTPWHKESYTLEDALPGTVTDVGSRTPREQLLRPEALI